MLKTLLLLLLFQCFSANAFDSVMEVIPIYNRTAPELQELIRPLLEPSEHIIANSSSLIVKATPARIEEIKNLIDQLDARLTNLLITVIQSRTKTAKELNANALFKINHSFYKRSSRLSGEIKGRFAQTQGLNNTDSTQVIKTLEGSPAYIKTGTNHPVQNISIYDSGYGVPTISSNTQFIETSTGFLVNPRLTGRQVTLEINPWSNKMNNNRTIETQEASTTVRVNLGEWIEIGGITEEQKRSGYGNLAHSYSTKNQRLHILIKVDKAP